VTVLVSRKGEKTVLRKELPVEDGRFVIDLVSAPSEAQKSLLKGWLAPSK